MFSPADITAAINTVMSIPTIIIPPGNTMVLASVIDGTSAQLVVAKKLGVHWQIEAVIEHPWAGPAIQGGFVIHAMW